MDAFLARQPIFDRKGKVAAYELLFRSGPENAFPAIDGDQATSRVIDNSMWVFGAAALTGGKRAFINFTRDLLLRELPLLLPKDWVTVEILETVPPEPEVLAALSRLKERRYTLALDDFIFQPGWEPILDLADIVKVDYQDLPPGPKGPLIKMLKARPMKLLAEKVEFQEEFNEAKSLGFHYFQGYFFSRPIMMSGRKVPASKTALLQLLHKASAPELDLLGLEKALKNDLSLSYRFLSFINSPYFGLRDKVTSLRQALVLLGEENTRKWVSLVVLAGLGEDRPDELVTSSLVRAHFAESLAQGAKLKGKHFDLFLMGLFSHLEALVGRPLSELLEALPLSVAVKQALLQGKGPLAPANNLVQAYERGEWEEALARSSQLGISQDQLPRHFAQALDMAFALAKSTS